MSSGLCEDSGTSLLLLVVMIKHLDSQVTEQSNLGLGDRYASGLGTLFCSLHMIVGVDWGFVFFKRFIYEPVR